MLFNRKAIIVEEHQWYYLTHSCGEKGAHNFLQGINPKLNVTVWLELELAYSKSAA